MADEQRAGDQSGNTSGGRPHFGPHNNSQAGPDERESLIGDNDLPLRAAGPAGESGGSGVPGLGGSPGGTSTGGGVGLPGGNRRLGEGPASERDAGAGATGSAGSLGTGGNTSSGLGGTPPTEVLPGGATRSVEGSAAGDRSGESAREDDVPSHPSQRGGIQQAPMPPESDADIPNPDAAEFDADTPVGGTASRSTPESPVPEEPSPGLMDHPGPEAEI